jgi:cellulose biosynthesis protein BcsQ
MRRRQAAALISVGESLAPTMSDLPSTVEASRRHPHHRGLRRRRYQPVYVVGRETVLKSCLSKTKRLADYDIVLLDNAPSISLVVMSSLVASDIFLMPCGAEYLPMVGLSLLSESIMKMKKLAPQLVALGVVLTLSSHNERICRQVETMLRKEIGDNLLATKIRVNTKANAAPSVQKTIFDYENSPKGRGTEDYTALAADLIQRHEPYSEQARVVNG